MPESRSGGAEEYSAQIAASIASDVAAGRTIAALEFIPDEQTELYFKAADLLVLPYTLVFQSGVLFLGYSFGLPAVASNVGSFAGDIIEGRTGYVCKECDADDLAKAIERYFTSDLYGELESRREEIRNHTQAGPLLDEVGATTRKVYAGLVNSESVPEKRAEQIMVITRTPLRISFFGGGTDYPVWYREHGGSVLATTIDKCCYITCRRLPPFFDYHSRISYSRVENVNRNDAIEHPSVRGVLTIHENAGRRRDPPRCRPAGADRSRDELSFHGWVLLGLYALKDQMRDRHAWRPTPSMWSSN